MGQISDFLPLFFYITCASKLHGKHRSNTYVNNYVCSTSSYVHVENNSLSKSMNYTKIQREKRQILLSHFKLILKLKSTHNLGRFQFETFSPSM